MLTVDTNAAAELIARTHGVRGEAEMSFRVTVTTGVEGLRLRELGKVPGTIPIAAWG